MSDIGRVIDLSPSGMRIHCRRPPKGEFITRIFGIGQTLEIKGRVVWVKNRGLFSCECGVEFIELEPEIVRTLNEFGMTNQKHRVI